MCVKPASQPSRRVNVTVIQTEMSGQIRKNETLYSNRGALEFNENTKVKGDLSDLQAWAGMACFPIRSVTVSGRVRHARLGVGPLSCDRSGVG